MTVYASQGKTIDGDVFIYYTSGMDRPNTYVAGSRHKDNSHWFISDEDIELSSNFSSVKLTKENQITALSKLISTIRKASLAIEQFETVYKTSKSLEHELDAT